VVHAAGVIADEATVSLSAEDMVRVMAPKVVGAWALHQSLGDEPLEFFVLFSSGASWLGSPENAHYSAANAFLDALAAQRQQAGLKASSIAWGPWSGDGMLHERRRAALTAFGLRPFDDTVGLNALSAAVWGNWPNVAVLSADWERLGSATHRRPLLARLLQEPNRTARLDTTCEAAAEDAAPVSADDVLGRLRRMIGELMMMEAEQVPEAEPLSQLGLDSIMAVQLAHLVEVEFGRKVASQDFADATLEMLAEELEAVPAEEGPK
jgi:acyl carrier protein